MGTLDSLMLIDLLVRIEQSIGVSISLEQVDLADLRSVRSNGMLVTRQLRPA